MDAKPRKTGVNRDITERRRVEAALRESEQRFRSLFENMLDGFAYCQMLFDDQERPVDFVYLAVNGAFERLTGLENVVGKQATEVIPGIKEANPELFEIYGRVALTGKPERFEIDFKPLARWLSISAYSTEKGAFVAVFDNITERKQAEVALQESEAKYRQLVETSHDVIWSVDTQGRITFVNQAAKRVYGYEPQELIGRLYSDFVSPKQLQENLAFAERVSASGEAIEGYENTFIRKDGAEIVLKTNAVWLSDKQGNVIGSAGIARDITAFKQVEAERERLFEELRQSHERLQALSRRLVEVQESERGRLAREIHDDISQSLTALIMQLGAAQSLLPRSAAPARMILEQAETLTKDTLEGVRRVIADLRPPVLNDLGLAPALQRLGRELHESAGATVTVESEGLPDHLPSQLESALFRIAQEALANIKKHAQARRATITLTVQNEWVILSVKDDGVGLPGHDAQARRRGDTVIARTWVVPEGHYGLAGIQERAALLGGTVQVQSAPGQGTTVRVKLPLGGAVA